MTCRSVALEPICDSVVKYDFLASYFLSHLYLIISNSPFPLTLIIFEG